MSHRSTTTRLLLAALALLAVAQASAQQFPTVPARSVIGRIGAAPGDTGPSQAIPFATLLANLVGPQTANKVYAGPASGIANFPTFRALIGTDVPAINLAAGNVNGGVTGVTPIANGGTNGATQQAALNNIAPTPTRAGDLMYYNGTNWVALAGNNSGNAVLTENSSGVPSWAASGAVSSVTCGTGLSGGVITTTGTCAVNYAAKSDQQTGTSTILTVNPSQQQSHDSAAKAWVTIASCSVATCTINASYNVSQVTRSGTGTYSVTFSPTAFATANYVCNANASVGTVVRLGAKTTTTIGIVTFNTSLAALDSDFDLACHGRQ